MDTPAGTCALCGKAVEGDEPAHAVHDKVICEACRGLVLVSGPRPVLPYADRGGRRRRWMWPAVATAVAAAVIMSLVFTAQRAAVERARAEQLRALAAEQRARADAEAARARRAETRPAE